jgi:hypothetical protein
MSVARNEVRHAEMSGVILHDYVLAHGGAASLAGCLAVGFPRE